MGLSGVVENKGTKKATTLKINNPLDYASSQGNLNSKV